MAAECAWGVGRDYLRLMINGFTAPKRLGGTASGQRRAEVARALNALGREVAARTPGGSVGGRIKQGPEGWKWVGRGGRGGGQEVLPPLLVSGGGGRARVTFGVVTQAGMVEDTGRVVVPKIDGVTLEEGPVLEYPEGAGYVMMRLQLVFVQETIGEGPELYFRHGEVREADVVWRAGTELPEEVYNGGGGIFYVPMARSVEADGGGGWRLKPITQDHLRVVFSAESYEDLPNVSAVQYFGWPSVGVEYFFDEANSS